MTGRAAIAVGNGGLGKGAWPMAGGFGITFTTHCVARAWSGARQRLNILKSALLMSASSIASEKRMLIVF
jgi:hypothetical protein